MNTAAAGAAAAVVSLAHSGNSSTNWLAVCNQFGDFCQQASGAVVGSFAAVLLFLLLILFSALSLKNSHWDHSSSSSSSSSSCRSFSKSLSFCTLFPFALLCVYSHFMHPSIWVVSFFFYFCWEKGSGNHSYVTFF